MLLLLIAMLAGAPPQPPTAIVARDYVLDIPALVPGPIVHLRFTNEGREPHYLRFLAIEGNQTLDDFAAWRKAGGPMPSWLRGAGGVGTLAPGESATFSGVLKPGRYIVMCGHPSPDGIPHVDRGMYRLVTIGERTSGDVRLADATLVLKEHAIEMFGQPRAGDYGFQIVNQGRVTHQALVVLLPQGVTVEQELDWFRKGSRGTRPGHPVGGVIELPPDHEAQVRLRLRPGRYAIFCSVPGGSGRHFDSGMIQTFEITAPSPSR